MKIQSGKRTTVLLTIILITAALLAFWWSNSSPTLPAGFTESNGRIEATEVDIATKIPGRIADIYVKEGDFVKKDQVLAIMDSRNLKEQLIEAQAQIREAQSAILTAQSSLAQRESEKNANQAMVKQREAELQAAKNRYERSIQLSKRGAVSEQQLDDDKARSSSAEATLEASKAQVMAAEAAIEAAKAAIVQANIRVEAAQATERRIQTDLDDSELKAPRDGRIQYRIAEPGEVLGAGGRVLNMVDVGDVYMTFFLSTEDAGRVALGSEVHIVLDAAQNFIIPAHVSYVANVAQFTPKTVETDNERLKLMFRVKARIDAELLNKYPEQVKTGLPGKAYIQLDSQAAWPEHLQVRLP